MIVKTVKIPDDAQSLDKLSAVLSDGSLPRADSQNKHHRLLVIIDWLLNIVWDFIEPLFSAALASRYPNSANRGRRSPPAPVLFRLLLLRRLFNWSFEEVVNRAREPFYARFCLLFNKDPPSASALCRWSQVISFDTLKSINKWLVALAKLLGVTFLRKFRLDTTVVNASIHYPTDVSLLVDGVRVLSRLLSSLRRLPKSERDLFGAANLRSRYRSAKRTALHFTRALRRKGDGGKQERERLATKLLKIQKRSLRQAKNVISQAKKFPSHASAESTKLVQKITADLSVFLPSIEECLLVAEKQLLKGQKVASEEKLVSIFMEDVAIIRRGKTSVNVEFGRKVLFVEAAPGIIVDFAVPKGNPADSEFFSSAIDNIKALAPAGATLTADTGFFSADNEKDGQRKGNRVFLKKKGKRSAERFAFEHSRPFRKAYRFRAGIEGRICVLERRHGLMHCRDTSAEAIPRWVGWTVVSHNLQKMAEILGFLPKEEQALLKKRLERCAA